MPEDSTADVSQDTTDEEADPTDPGSSPGRNRDNEIILPEPEVDPEGESARLAVWGRLGSHGESEPLAVYWEIGTELLDEGDADGDDEGNPERTVPLEENYVAILSGDTDLTNYNPNLPLDEFYRRLLDYRVDETPTPETALAEYREAFEEYLNEARFNWLKQFVREGDEDELANWFEGFLEEVFPEGLPHYRLNVTFARPDTHPEESLEETVEDSGAPGDTEVPEESPDEDSGGTTLDISLMTDPEDGVRAPRLRVGQEVFLRIVGPGVEHLPEDLIERERSSPSSVPMVGPVTDINERPDVSEKIDSDPENYREIKVRIEPGISGVGLVFRDDRIKVPVDEEEQSDLSQDLLLMGSLLAILLVVVGMILFL